MLNTSPVGLSISESVSQQVMLGGLWMS